jgi:hypothetical protein
MIVTQTMGAAPGRFPLQIERLWRCTGGSILDQLKQGFEGELGVAEQAVANQCAGCVAWIVRDLQELARLREDRPRNVWVIAENRGADHHRKIKAPQTIASLWRRQR